MAEKMTVRAAAKINLSLDVVGKLENGYHALESVFQSVGLYDEVTVELAEDISVGCEVPPEFAEADEIPCDERNIAYKAAKRFFESAGIEGGCHIHIKKGIPSQAGMGGGSADAAAVLYCLSRLTGAEITAPEKIGADVPFMLAGGTAYVEGIGEKITPIADYSGKILVIAKGKEGVSTAEAYRNIDSLTSPVHPETAKLTAAINGIPDEAYRYFGNLFEQAVELDEVKAIKTAMLESGALNAVMTGSGSAVFGLFEEKEDADICAGRLAADGFFAKVCETVPCGIGEV